MNQQEYFRQAIKRMRLDGVTFEEGLIDNELDEIESRCKFQFPPDLRAFLKIAHPVRHDRRSEFPNWRNRSINPVLEEIKWISKGILAQVSDERQPFWIPEWGQRPETINEALAIIKGKIDTAPLLIPVYGHRFLVAEPCIEGNPVFSVYDVDTIYYGFDLAGYFHHEFGVRLPEWAAKTPRCIPFWSDFDYPCDETRTGL